MDNPCAFSSHCRFQPRRRSVSGRCWRRRGKRGEGRVSFVVRGSLHFALAFLGEQPGSEEALVTGEVLRETRPFDLALSGVGAFPNTARPRVLWLGVTDGAAELMDAAERLRRALRQRGFQIEDRKFRAHLTIGRVRPRGERFAKRALAAIKPEEFARWTAGEASCWCRASSGAEERRTTSCAPRVLSPGPSQELDSAHLGPTGLAALAPSIGVVAHTRSRRALSISKPLLLWKFANSGSNEHPSRQAATVAPILVFAAVWLWRSRGLLGPLDLQDESRRGKAGPSPPAAGRRAASTRPRASRRWSCLRIPAARARAPASPSWRG
jgi:2'-5' RNA ligase